MSEQLGPNHEKEQRLRPRIYVASLSDYNAGRIHGAWLDAARSAEELLADISEMLAGSSEPIAEEWAIHDFEGFGSTRLSEYESIETVSKVALGIAEHGAAFAAWASALDDWEQLETFDHCYVGHWDSLSDYAEELLDSFGLTQIIEQAVPEGLQRYVKVDVEAFGRDLAMDGTMNIVEDAVAGGIFLFDST